MKLGEKGCVVVDGKDSVLIPAPRIDAVDTTGAGDIFNAGLAVALSEGLDLHAACRFANRAAALSVTRLGAQSAVPTRAEVDKFVEQAPSQAIVVLPD